jgi:hypothetical protein
MKISFFAALKQDINHYNSNSFIKKDITTHIILAKPVVFIVLVLKNSLSRTLKSFFINEFYQKQYSKISTMTTQLCLFLL